MKKTDHREKQRPRKRFGRSESGATAIEYALMAAGIALAIVTTVQGVGTQLTTKYDSVDTGLTSLN